MDDVRKITKGVILRFVSTNIVVVLGLVMSVILNRHFGKNEYGLLILVYSVTSFFTVLSHLGTRPSINKFVPSYIKAQEIEKVAQFISVSFIIQVFGILLCSFIFWVSIPFISVNLFHRHELIPLLKIGIFFFVGLSLFNFTFEIFQALQDWVKDAILNIIYPAFYLFIVALIIFVMQGNLQNVLLANAIASFSTSILGLFLIPRNIMKLLVKGVSLRHVKEYSTKIFNFGIPLLFSTFLFYIYSWFDKVILGIHRTNEELTFYYIAVSFSIGFMSIFKTLFTVLMPYLAGFSNSSSDTIKSKFNSVFRWLLHLSVILIIFLFFAVKPLIVFLYGYSYFPVIFMFRLMLIAFFLRAASNSYYMFLVNVYGKSKLSLRIGAIAIAINIIISLVLIPKYGFIGAVVAAITSSAVTLIIFAFLKEFRHITPYKSFLNSCKLFGVVLIIFFTIKKLHIGESFVLGIFFSVVYIVMLYFFKEIKDSDIIIVKKIIGLLSFKHKPV